MTYFGNIYGQYRIEAEVLSRLSAPEFEAVRRAAYDSKWTEDASGNLLCTPVRLTVPASAERTSEQPLRFPWTDRSTATTAFRIAQAQLLAFDVHAGSPRGSGDVQLRLSGHVSDTEGQPLFMFTPVPRTLLLKLAQDFREELGFLSTAMPMALAYRVIELGDEVRTAELQARFLARKKQIDRVRFVQVFDHRLFRRGDEVVHEATMRAIYHADDPASNRHVPVLASSQMTGLIAHALSTHSDKFYGRSETTECPSASARGLALMAQFRPAPQQANKSAEAPVINKQDPPALIKAATAAVEDEPALETEEIAPAVSEKASEGAHREMETVESVASEPSAPHEPAGIWTIEEVRRWMVVDDEVLTSARAALRRRKPLLLQGAPGTGKTLLATRLAEAVCGAGNYTLVTADARWTSTEVIGGLKVQPGSGLNYRFSPGVVTRAVSRHEESVRTTGRPHALIIDEFNRAHQDEAFGRLLTLLDPAYRRAMALVGEEDGAEQAVYLPEDFLLLATMNDADIARLHEIGAALSRRFTIIRMGIPRDEQDYLASGVNEAERQQLDQLYDFVGSGERSLDQEGGRLRAFAPVGTYFMKEALELLRSELTVDEALLSLTEPLLAELNRDALTALQAAAHRGGLPRLQAAIEDRLADALF